MYSFTNSVEVAGVSNDGVTSVPEVSADPVLLSATNATTRDQDDSFLSLPAKYRRRPLGHEEIEFIEVSIMPLLLFFRQFYKRLSSNALTVNLAEPLENQFWAKNTVLFQKVVVGTSLETQHIYHGVSY